MVKELLQFLIGEVNTQLLEAVVLHWSWEYLQFIIVIYQGNSTDSAAVYLCVVWWAF